ncbi:MAG: class I adenylate-forming enzyme family protein [Candidatus Hydrogenedentota bacterium]
MGEQNMPLLWQYVDYWAERKPDAEAIVFEGTRLTWSQFRDAVDKAAHAFLEVGVERGDRVAMLSMARPEFLISFMAAAKVGAIWVGMSPKFSMEELQFLLNDSQPCLLVAQDTFQGADVAARARMLADGLSSVRKVLILGGQPHEDRYADFVARPRPEYAGELEERAVRTDPDAACLLMYTSGSTGKPKGVLHSHQSILANVAVERKHFGFDENARALIHFPINHVAADVEIGFTGIYGGGTLVLMDRFDAQKSLEVIEQERITVVGQVPVMFLMQMQAPKFREMDWSSVRAFVWSGSAAGDIMLGALHQIAAQTGAAIMTGYGSTELCGFVTYSHPEDPIDVLRHAAGKIAPEFELRIVDDEHNPLPAGEVGEIAVRGDTVMKGYLNNPAATAEVIDDNGWYYTRDMGYLDEQGYLYITGRRSEMFKTGGENVFPREVEEVLEHHPAVLFAAVIGVHDDFYDEVGHAFIMLKPGYEVTAGELRDHCKAHLANFKAPKKFDIRSNLPLLPTGKVSKVALKKELGLETE